MSASYDVVIVGAGVSGNMIAWQLGLAGKKVLILEAGAAVPDNRADYMDNFYLSLAKTPESPYPPIPNNGAGGKALFPLPDPATQPTPRATVLMIGKKPDQSYLVQDTAGSVSNPAGTAVRGIPFSSTYERIGGGTSWHWLGSWPRMPRCASSGTRATRPTSRSCAPTRSTSHCRSGCWPKSRTSTACSGRCTAC